DAVAAVIGFTRPVTFEGQAAAWLEHLAAGADACALQPMRFDGAQLDWRSTLRDVVQARRSGEAPAAIARGFHRALARGIADAILRLADEHAVDVAVLSGGVFQNELLLEELAAFLDRGQLRIWTNHLVPANDGGISLGQAALVSCRG